MSHGNFNPDSYVSKYIHYILDLFHLVTIATQNILFPFLIYCIEFKDLNIFNKSNPHTCEFNRQIILLSTIDVRLHKCKNLNLKND